MQGLGYIRQNPVCPDCHRTATKQPDGKIRCDCPNKNWRLPNPVRADSETETLLRRKGFLLAPFGPSGPYYYKGTAILTVYDDDSWSLQDFEQPTTTNLIEYLSSLSDVAD
jgi:hypothetical protein